LREHLAAGWCYYVEWDKAAARGVVLRDATREGLPSLAGSHDVSDVPEFLDTLRTGNVLNGGEYAKCGIVDYKQLSSHTFERS